MNISANIIYNAGLDIPSGFETRLCAHMRTCTQVKTTLDSVNISTFPLMVHLGLQRKNHQDDSRSYLATEIQPQRSSHGLLLSSYRLRTYFNIFGSGRE